MNLSDSFCILVYPFFHNVPRLNQDSLVDKVGRRMGLRSAKNQKLQLLDSLNSAWQFWMGRLDPGEREVALDNTYFYLPYVRALLFPETSALSANTGPAKIDRIEEWVNLPVQQIIQIAAEQTTIRLTCRPEKLQELKMCELVARDFKAPLEICWIDLFLFPQKIGFLLIQVKLREEKPPVDRMIDVIHHIRRVHPPYVGGEVSTWRFPWYGKPVEVQSARLIDYLLQGLVNELPVEEKLLSLDEFLHRPQSSFSKGYTESPAGQTYGAVLHTYAYACLDRKPGEQFSAEELAASDPLFSSPFQHALYELATYSKTSDFDSRPTRQHLQSRFDAGLIEFWHNWQAMALRGSVAFLANYETDFTQIYLPRNIESDYLPLYLFVLYQETRLSLMFGSLMETEKSSNANLKRARALWGEFLKFQNHYWFTEVTHKSQGSELYHIFQQALGVQPLYDKQNEEVQVLREFYESKTQRQTSRMINFLTFVGVPVGILSQMYGSVLIKSASWWDPILVMVGTVALLAGLWYLVFREK